MRIICIILLTFMILVGCSNENDYELYGTFESLENNELHLNVTEWTINEGDVGEQADVGYMQILNIDENTKITFENGEEVDIEDIEFNQILGISDYEGDIVKEITILNK
ncbi:hypothetical protein [Cytobacillus gottheilii]|uniref:hypothetical protein n=1 Tax=Cytobacillus gottheilii TaxID=859144 RepID=UPI003CF137A4